MPHLTGCLLHRYTSSRAHELIIIKPKDCWSGTVWPTSLPTNAPTSVPAQRQVNVRAVATAAAVYTVVVR